MKTNSNRHISQVRSTIRTLSERTGWNRKPAARGKHALILVATAMALLSGCDQHPLATGSTFEQGDTVDLRALPPAGLKWTTHTRSTGTVPGTNAGMEDETDCNCEVIAATADSATVKMLESSDFSAWGGIWANPEADLAKNRLSVVTFDRCGTILKQEGMSRDQWETGAFPDKPLKLGESFTVKARGRGVDSSYRGTITYTVDEVVTANGRRLVVLDSVVEGNRSTSGSGREWRDLETGIVVKATYSGYSTLLDGTPISTKVTMTARDADGKPWID